MKTKIFIDCGFHHGEGLRHFAKELHIDHTWIVICFEPNPACLMQERLNCFGWPYTKPLVFANNLACWISYGEELFSHCLDSESSGLFLEGSIPISGFRSIYVPCIDFSAWLSQIPEQYDEIYCKMDIEGAEFEVLRKMIRDKSALRLTKIWVEFHERFLQYENSTTHMEILHDLTKCTIVEGWH